MNTHYETAKVTLRDVLDNARNPALNPKPESTQHSYYFMKHKLVTQTTCFLIKNSSTIQCKDAPTGYLHAKDLQEEDIKYRPPVLSPFYFL